MPGYRGHLFGAIIPIIFLVFLMAFLRRPFSERFLAILFCFLGSLAPDIDVASRARVLFVALIGLCALFIVLTGRWSFLLALFFVLLFVFLQRHRALLHRLWFWLFLSGFVCLSSWLWFIDGIQVTFVLSGAFTLGVLSHLYLDGCRLF